VVRSAEPWVAMVAQGVSSRQQIHQIRGILLAHCLDVSVRKSGVALFVVAQGEEIVERGLAGVKGLPAAALHYPRFPHCASTGGSSFGVSAAVGSATRSLFAALRTMVVLKG